MSESSESDHIGRIGEGAFHQLAEKAKLLVGKVDPDRIGKDRIIEFELDARKSNLSFDKRPPPLKCAVQIKSIKTTTQRVKISLSVAERLIGDPTPTFIAVLKVDQDDEISEMRMIHLLGRPMERVLKRLRQEYAKGTEKLNDHEITFGIDEAESVPFTKDGLVDFLQTSIGPDIEKYAALKASQRNDVGYEPENRLTLQTTFGETTISEFVDGMLGLRALPVVSVKAFEERFSIKLPHDSLFPPDMAGATLEVQPSTKTFGKITLRSHTANDVVELEAEVIVPAVPNLPMEHFKVRLKTEFLEIILSNGKLDFSSGAHDWSEIHTLKDWTDFIRAWRILSFGECSFEFENGTGQVLRGTGRNNTATDTDRLLAYLPLLEGFAKIREEARVSERGLSLQSVHNARAAIARVNTFFSAENCGGEFACAIEILDEEKPEELLVLFVSTMSVGDEHYLAALKLTMQPELPADHNWWKSVAAEPLAIEPFVSEDEFLRACTKLMRISGCHLSITYPLEGSLFSVDKSSD